jgi:uncharacterized membrane protein YkoI
MRMTCVSKLFAPALMVCSVTLAAAPALANIAINEAQAVQAGVIGKVQAERVALRTVGGGRIVSAVLEKEDNGLIHWSIDIRGARYEYEVWVSTSGKVLKIITQPL